MISQLKGILNPDIVFDVCVPNRFVIISENKPNTKLDRLEVNFLPSVCLAFSLDYDDKGNERLYNQLTHYVNKSVGVINKSCDLVLVEETDDSYIFRLIEMKSDYIKGDSVFDQLRNSKIYIQYLISMIDEYFSNFKKKKIIFKNFVVATKKRSNSKSNVHPSKRQAPRYKTVSVEVDSFKKATIGYGRLL